MKLSVIKYTIEYKIKWNEFNRSSKNGSFLFDREFIEYHQDRFIDYSLIVLKNNQIVALLPANISDNIVYSHQGLTYGGLIVNTSIKMPDVIEIFKEILIYLKTSEINKMVLKNTPHIYHTYPADEIEWVLTCIKANLYRRDSTLSIFNKYPLTYQERRIRSIKKARKLNPIIKTNETDGLDKFWNEVLVPNMLKKHNIKPVHNLTEIKRLASIFPENIKQYNIYLGEQIMAGCTMFLNPTVAHAQYISGTDEGRSNGCLDFLFNFLIKEEFNSYSYFDFGNSNEDAGTKINFGLLDWKEGFGGRAVSHDFYEIDTTKYYLLENVNHV